MRVRYHVHRTYMYSREGGGCGGGGGGGVVPSTFKYIIY